MSKQAPLTDFLEEHIPYELKMLRRNYRHLGTITDRLDWNTCYVSFAAHARALVGFLRNDDTNNIRASDFIEYRTKPDIEDIKGVMQLLNVQVLHIGKRRVRELSDKFTVNDATPVYEWIEKELEKFLNELPQHYRDHWNELEAGQREKIIELSPDVPSASSLSGFATSDPAILTTASVSELTIVIPDGSTVPLHGYDKPSAGTVPSSTGPESPFSKQK